MESTIYTVDGREFELQHYGVKGMRWGVRRFQNKDGSLTSKGRKRYGLDEDGKLVKKSATTRMYEKLAESGYKNQKKQSALYERVGNEYHKQSADLWKREADANSESARKSFDLDKRISKDKKGFKADVKYAKKKGLVGDYTFDPVTRQLTVQQWYDRNGAKIDHAYASRVMGKASRDRTIARFAGTTAAIVGANVVAAMLSGK